MPSRTPRRPRWAAPLALLLALPLAAAGCGDAPQERGAAAPERSATAAFPAPRGRSLDELRRGLGPGPSLAPSVHLLEPGRSRFGFGLFDRRRRQIARAPVALYVSRLDGTGVRGPFPARWESLEVAPRFRSRSVSDDPDAAASLYTSTVSFPRAGRYAVMGVARLDDRLVATEPIPARVTESSPVLGPGQRAPQISTPTAAQVDDVAKIETRVPPDDMHEVDFAHALGRRPIVIVFSTPALCASRVCGPVVDIAQEVKATHRGDAAFIHMEIYRNNRVEDGLRPQVRRFGLPSEPWAFAIDRHGRVVARLEGAFSARELRAAAAAAERG